MMGFISIKTGRDVVFFNQGGLRDLPLVYMLVAMVSVIGAMIHLQAIKQWGVRSSCYRWRFWEEPVSSC